MSVELVEESAPQTTKVEEIALPPTAADLIYDDGEPLESNRHRIAMNVLIDSVHQAYQGRNDYFAGGNMFIYYSIKQVKNQDFRGPDFFAVLNVDGSKERLSWVMWEEEGRYPDVIVELLSASTSQVDKGAKKELYEKTFKTPDYFVYDPFDGESLQGWRLGTNFRYEPITPNEKGWLWCESLGLWLGTWQGTLTKETATWARFYDPEGNLVLLPAEVAVYERERAEAERQQKEQAEASLEEERRKNQVLREHLQALGIDPDSLS